ncbi:mRNA-degrading endonuclease YafQ of YafQ-DinJ toxin-antitoxin module [Scopulibacillus daqui]|uniref:mRNA-degrading endonuclease YafQ of YafQ-DinJ toxin-antitoxin module n=1 Tax=Scopulibacillus daqui TaxID=1469162 RepID=A0ABS2Q4I0_9BACL|nr:cytotoxin [Scopulibacillus daqui]MBM7647031.1 mRNA-degrading endonuclease YafQ of YafQ-DinJ toxin-antitoxin module [Scopulibacillus daqui]
MNFRRTDRFNENFAALDAKSQKAIKKAIAFLAHDPRHPSLRTKKMEGWDYIFEASANMDIRLTFHFEKPDTIVLRNCGHHDRTLRNP